MSRRSAEARDFYTLSAVARELENTVGALVDLCDTDSGVGRKFPTGSLIGDCLDLNRRTVVDADAGLWKGRAVLAPAAFLRYKDELSSARERYSDQHVFIAVVDSGGEANRTALIAPGESLIVGRHKKCDIKIAHTNVALRQLAIHLATSSTGDRPLIRVWDLHTGTSLLSEHDTPIEALAADGPVFLSLGRYHLAIVPLGLLPKTLPASSNEAWASLPDRRILSALAEGTGSRLLVTSSQAPGLTTITEMPSSLGLEGVERMPVPSSCVVGSLAVQSPDHRRIFRLGIEHLERGILVGRYSRCLGQGLDATVSRVHVLLASVGGDLVAIDTASTSGCRRGETHIATTLLQGDCTISLGKHSYLHWRPRFAGNA